MGKPRGLAALSPEQRKRIAAQGGRASQTSGNGFRWSSDNTDHAKSAGKKGGQISKRSKNSRKGVK